MQNRILTFLALTTTAVSVFASASTLPNATMCNAKYWGADVQLEELHSPTPSGELKNLVLNLTALEDLSSVSFQAQGEGMFSGTSLSQGWGRQAKGSGHKLSIPLVMNSADAFGRILLRIEVCPSASSRFTTRTLEISAFQADGQLYCGWENGVELQMQHIAALEAGGAITPEDAATRRSEATTLKETTALPASDRLQAKTSALALALSLSPSEDLVITGQVQWKDHSGTKGTGGLFPVIGMHIQAFDSANPTVALASAQTDRAGRYTFNILHGAVSSSSNAFNLLLRAESQSSGFQIYAPGTTTLYKFEKTVTGILNQASINSNAAAFNINFDKISGVAANVSAQNRVWAAYSALFLLKEFADASSQLRYPPNLPCQFPIGGTVSYYTKDTGNICIISDDYADFDVIFHEYSHFTQNRFSLTSSVGGNHSSQNDLIVTTGSKSTGIDLAWSEGMATALGMAMETEGRFGTSLAPRFGNQTYDDSEDSDISYPAETEGSRPNISEGNEATVMRILFDLFDGSGSGEDFDKVSWGFDGLVSTLRYSGAKNLNAFWIYLSGLGSGYTWTPSLPVGSTTVSSVDRTVLDQYAPIFAKNNVAPDPISPKNKAELDAFTGDKVTFRWRQNINTVRGDFKFRVLFMDSYGNVLKSSDEVGGTTASIEQKLDVSKSLIQSARDAAGESKPLFWTVAGVDSAPPATGVYVGPALPLDASGRILLVIDDTGSMGDEIDAVKQGLLNYLNRFDPTLTSTRFQLITFKDDVYPRASTTSLEEIKNQVGQLYASGGGDEPEASVEALWLAADMLSSEGTGGTVFLATDAPPHSGLSIPATIAKLRAAGIRVNVILTQYGFAKDSAAIARLQATKPDDTGAESPSDGVSGADLAAMIPDTPFAGSTDAYGAIADATGGIFLGLAKSDTSRITAAVENVTASASFPALIQAIPGSAPAGATLDVIIQGQNSDFDETSVISFSRGIRVNSITRNSPVELSANITITNTEPVGSVDVSVKTSTDMATGVNLFDITAPTSLPTTLSVNPAVGTRGAKMRVSIAGLNTDFTSNSVVNFSGTAIIATNIVAVTSNSLTTDLIIADDAPSSYYTVSVDGVSKAQAFRVSSAAIADMASITSLQTNRLVQGANKKSITILGQNTTFSSSSHVNFSGLDVKADNVKFLNPTQLVVQVTVSSQAKPGFRDVFVTTGGSTVSGLKMLQIVQPPGKITISVVGNGTPSPNLSGKTLVIGRTYRVTAIAKKGAVFAGWAGDLSTNMPRLSFKMPASLSLEARFVTNRYPSIKGVYNGFFHPIADASATNSGFLKLTLADSGAFSGKLFRAGKVLSFSSAAYADGVASMQLVSGTNAPLALNLQFNWDGTNPIVQGSVVGSSWTADLNIEPVSPAPKVLAGIYTGVIPGSMDAATPAGQSPVTVKILNSGTISVSGTLADSVRFSQGGSGLTKDGCFPLFASLYKGSGILMGWFSFGTNEVNREFTGGNVLWQKQPIETEKFYPAGFSVATNVQGSSFTTPVKGAGTLSFSNATLIVSGGDFDVPVQTDVQIIKNKIKVTGGVLSNLSLTISAANGAMTGTFVHPSTHKATKVTGVTVQDDNLGGGWFLGPTQSGSILLIPAVP